MFCFRRHEEPVDEYYSQPAEYDYQTPFSYAMSSDYGDNPYYEPYARPPYFGGPTKTGRGSSRGSFDSGSSVSSHGSFRSSNSVFSQVHFILATQYLLTDHLVSAAQSIMKGRLIGLRDPIRGCLLSGYQLPARASPL